MTELDIVAGKASDEQLAWIGALYGAVDPKYASTAFLRHQFVDNPLGWSVHVFALDGGRPVAHTAAIPCRARDGEHELIAAKVEALVVAESHRGRLPDGTSLAVLITERLHEATHERGVPVLFALATAQANRVFERAGFRPVRHGAFSYVAITNIRGAVRGRGWAVGAAVAMLAAMQRLWLTTVFMLARLGAGAPSVAVREAAPQDAELVSPQRADGWTISGSDAWDWYAKSGLLRTVEIAGRAGSRAVVRLPSGDDDHAPAQIVAWQPQGDRTLAAVLLLGTVAQLARTAGADTLRVQPWHGAGTLARTCRRLGFLRRPIVELELHGDSAFDRVELSSFFYVTF